MGEGTERADLALDSTDRSPDLTGIDAWVDLTSPAIPHFFGGIVDGLDALAVHATVRDKGSTADLARLAGFDSDVVGRDPDRLLTRVPGVGVRTLQLWRRAPACDVSLSFQNAMCVLASKARGIPSIHFSDNDITAHTETRLTNRVYTRLQTMATYTVVPSAFETRELVDRGADPETVFTYGGYKEDVYVATFEPDPAFTDRLPFEEYVVVRPEALTAAYVDADRSIVPDLLDAATDRGFNVVYLPRGRSGDRSHADPYPDGTVYTPDRTLDGLQLAWHADCVMTGSGTMAREAACMGKPAVSFFPEAPLSVDRELIAEGRIYRSRDPADILSYVERQGPEDRRADRSRARETHAEVCRLVGDLIAAAVDGTGD